MSAGIMRFGSLRAQKNTIHELLKQDIGKFDWLKKLWHIDEMQIRQTCGTDVALYLTYLRYCAILFGISKTPNSHLTFIVALCSCLVLLPIYILNFNSEEVQITSFLERLTLISVQGKYYSVWIVFFFTVVYSLMGHMLIYFFEEKRKSWKVDIKEDPTELTESEISLHSVLLRGINEDIPLQEA